MQTGLSSHINVFNIMATKILKNDRVRPDMTFAVDWALSNNYLSIYRWSMFNASCLLSCRDNSTLTFLLFQLTVTPCIKVKVTET